MTIHVRKGTAVDTPEKALTLLRSESEKRMVIHEGTYYGTSLVLTAEDSGLVIEGEGLPVLSGGVIADSWHVDEKTGWFYTDIPSKDGVLADFRSLITTDRRYLKMARYPLEGSIAHETPLPSDVLWRGSVYGGWGRNFTTDELDNIIYTPGSVPDTLVTENAYIQVFHSWNESFVRLRENDRVNHKFYLDPPCGHPPGAWKKAFAIYNTVEGMLEDGRWYLDSVSGKIWYRPLPGETPETFHVVVPMTESVIKLEGCENVTLRGISVTGATSTVATYIFSVDETRGAGGFCALEQSAAVFGENVAGVTLDEVNVYNSGATGIRLSGTDLHVKNCHAEKLGAAGISVKNCQDIPGELITGDYSGWSAIENCTVSNIGLQYCSGPGIFTDRCMVRGCYISDTSYSGIVAYGDYIIIENNIVRNPMLTLVDGAAIYKLLDQGGIIRNNICVNDVQREEMYAGLYLDAPGVDWQMYGNVVRGFKLAMHNHIGNPGIVWRDNYFEYDGDMRMTCQRSVGESLVNNVVVCKHLKFDAPEEALARVEGNIVISQSDSITWNVTAPERNKQKPCYDVLETRELKEPTGVTIYVKA